MFKDISNQQEEQEQDDEKLEKARIKNKKKRLNKKIKKQLKKDGEAGEQEPEPMANQFDSLRTRDSSGDSSSHSISPEKYSKYFQRKNKFCEDIFVEQD
jgi:hypothetical protein